MTNYQYKGIDMNNIIAGIKTANRPTVVNSFPDLTRIAGIDSSFNSTTIITAERPSNTGYRINGVDISTYSIAKYIEFTTSGSKTVSTLMGSTMATRITAVLIGGGGSGGAGTSNQFKAEQNQSYVARKTDCRFRVYNSGVVAGQQLPQNADISIYRNGTPTSYVQIRGAGNSGVNAQSTTTNGILGTVKFALQQLYQASKADTGFTNIIVHRAQGGGTLNIQKPQNQGDSTCARILQLLNNQWREPFDNQYQVGNHFNAETNRGRVEGQPGIEGKFVLLSSAVTQASLQVTVGAAQAGVTAVSNATMGTQETQTTALAGNPSSIVIGGTRYNSEQAGQIGPASTNQYSTSLNGFGVAGAGGAPGVEGAVSYGQSGGGGARGYVRVYLYYD
jgi:hypothetical protein